MGSKPVNSTPVWDRVQEWSCVRILSAFEKIPRKQDKSPVTSVSLKHRIFLGMFFRVPPKYSRQKCIYSCCCYLYAFVGKKNKQTAISKAQQCMCLWTPCLRNLPRPCFQTPSISDPEIQITETVRSETVEGQVLLSVL